MTVTPYVSPLRQRGSTLTGIIIGLIIGLGIAVAVALLITKGASPFTDRSNKAGRPADLDPSKARDPNTPLYGNRNAAREANRELSERAAPAPAPAPSDSGDPLGAAIAGMQETPPNTAAPAASAPQAAPAAPAAPAAASPTVPGADGYIYYLQAGAFREMSDAENTRAKLALLGFEATISDRATEGGVLHRVRVGPYSHEAMNKARAKLLDSGIDVAIVRNQK